MSVTVDLVVIERAGQRLAFPAARVTAIRELPRGSGAARLQERLGQPPLCDDERCVALEVWTADGDAIVAVAGRVTIAAVDPGALAALPPPLAGACPVTAVVFGDEVSVLVLDVDAVVARDRAVPDERVPEGRARLGEEGV